MPSRAASCSATRPIRWSRTTFWPRSRLRSQVKGFAKPVRNYKVLDRLDDMVEQGKVVREERDGVRVVLDLQKLGKVGATKVLESILSRLNT